MNTDQELESLRAEWRSLGDQGALSSSLLDRVSRDSARMRRAAALEIAGVIFSTSVIVSIAVWRGGPEMIALTALICTFNGAWLTHFFVSRASLYQAPGQSLDAFVSLTRGRSLTERRWARAAQRWHVAIGLALLPLLVWIFVAHREAYLASPLHMITGFGGAALIYAGSLVYLRRKARKLEAEAEAFERELAGASLG